ncbi:tyrosine-type recombinase/integrase [Brevibacterium casei]|uniref:Site-specific tyrosine recombinase XerC n=1 Tax=Brevibacterium casei TaxID=33889 RepID=A0A449CYL8_9MICO|nr:tyrosine-type recombinase/integrase [Brevibacterium casei]VEW10368.1 site-specific tyrosine recombinase XerC [Brevibacterium casei]
MSRPRLELGSWGKITRTEISEGKWRARARFRDFTGKTKQREAYGDSGAKAERNLLKTLRAEVESAGDSITGNTTVTALSKVWLADPDLTETCTEQTIERYKDSLNQHVLPALGEYLLMEVTVSRVDRFLRTLAESTPGLAKTARTVLNGMFKLAVRHDAIRSNPVRDVRLPSKPKKPVEALTVDEVSALREGLRKWQDGTGYRGPRRGSELLDVVDVMLGTGLRISEVLALRWDDVDLGEHPTLTVSGTLVYLKKRGLRRQSHTKTASGFRILTLPTFAVEVLLRRSVEMIPTETNAVFPSGAGTWKWPNNYRRSLRDALKTIEGQGRISPHVFRKSVATLIDAEATLEAAAAVLGHSGTAVTSKHYVAKAAAAPDMSAILDRFGRSRNEKDG